MIEREKKIKKCDRKESYDKKYDADVCLNPAKNCIFLLKILASGRKTSHFFPSTLCRTMFRKLKYPGREANSQTSS
jgi:hypothetical protein